ncbi:hypothetical protein [Sulfurospirillum arcachonense]|uniref:hypothetical protein n=1 Tax=Sulfurospirillum arcachonense TaxID=57666 RepID=UPI000469C41F|nr:hypothetical protein [Sulfurospirillum arcachonense]
MKKIMLIVLISFSALVFSGCAVTSNTAKVVPYHNDVNLKNFYVLHQPSDKRNIDVIISNVLKDKGYNSSSGDGSYIPDNIDTIVTYEDRWFWDITNYLIQLNIEFRDAKDKYPYVAGESIRTSLARKSPQEMSIEIINNLFAKINGETK